jgi:hypothetical protein
MVSSGRICLVGGRGKDRVPASGGCVERRRRELKGLRSWKRQSKIRGRLAEITKKPRKMRVRRWCRRGESNPRPRDYETLALPLSYAGRKIILDATKYVQVVSSQGPFSRQREECKAKSYVCPSVQNLSPLVLWYQSAGTSVPLQALRMGRYCFAGGNCKSLTAGEQPAKRLSFLR